MVKSPINLSRQQTTALGVVLAVAIVIGLFGGGLLSFVPTYYENGQYYLEDTLFLNTPKEFYASNVPGFNGIKLETGQYANATGKVSVLLQTTKQNCVYSLTPQTGYVGGLFGIGAIRVTEYVPSIPTVDLAYDTYVNGNKVASSSPFVKYEIPITLPYNQQIQQSPIMKLVGQDSTAGQQSCMASADFIIIKVEDTTEARIGGIVGLVRIYDRSQYYSKRNDLLSSQSFIKTNVPSTGFDANANQFTYSNPNMGSAIVRVKIPFGAFNIVTYRPPPAGKAQLQGSCKIQDAYNSQQTNLQFAYKNIGEGSIFTYEQSSANYVYSAGDLSSGQPVPSGATTTVNWRVTPANSCRGTNTMKITVTGESGIATTFDCVGTCVENPSPVPAVPLPTPTQNQTPTPIVQGCLNPVPLIQKSVAKTVGGVSFLGLSWGGTMTTECVNDYAGWGIILFVIGIVGIVYGEQKAKKDIKEYGAYLAVFGIVLALVVTFWESTILSYLGGNGVLLLIAIAAIGYFLVKSKLAALI